MLTFSKNPIFLKTAAYILRYFYKRNEKKKKNFQIENFGSYAASRKAFEKNGFLSSWQITPLFFNIIE